MLASHVSSPFQFNLISAGSFVCARIGTGARARAHSNKMQRIADQIARDGDGGC